MTLAQRLVAQIQKSNEYSKKNFGAAVGEDFPPMCRELIQSKQVALTIIVDYLELMLSQGDVKDSMKDHNEMLKNGPFKFIEDQPVIYKHVMEFFYYGLQIGRELEREASQPPATDEPQVVHLRGEE